MIDLNYNGVLEAKALAKQAHHEEGVRELLFDKVFDNKGRESRNAAWALTHLPSSDIKHIVPHRDSLVRLVLSTSDTSLRRLALALLERLPWEESDIRSDLLDFCLLRIVDESEPYGVRALCIKLAWLQCQHYEELCVELRHTLLMLEPSSLKPGIKNTWSKTLKMASTKCPKERF